MQLWVASRTWGNLRPDWRQSYFVSCLAAVQFHNHRRNRDRWAFLVKEARPAILFVDRLIDQFLIDQESTKLVCNNLVSQRSEVAVEKFI